MDVVFFLSFFSGSIITVGHAIIVLPKYNLARQQQQQHPMMTDQIKSLTCFSIDIYSEQKKKKKLDRR